MGCLIPLSFLCGIVAGILIWRGGEMSKRTEEVEARLRGALEMERSLLEGDDRTGLGNDSLRDEPIQEKQRTHTAVQDFSNGVEHTPFDENGEHDIGLQDNPGDGKEASVGKTPETSEQLPQSSRRVSETSYHHEAYEKV